MTSRNRRSSTCSPPGSTAILLSPALPFMRAFDSGAQIVAVLPIDDPLRKIVRRILEHHPRARHFLQRKRRRRRAAVRHRQVDDLIALLLDAQELEHQRPALADIAMEADHRVAFRRGPMFFHLDAAGWSRSTIRQATPDRSSVGFAWSRPSQPRRSHKIPDASGERNPFMRMFALLRHRIDARPSRPGLERNATCNLDFHTNRRRRSRDAVKGDLVRARHEKRVRRRRANRARTAASRSSSTSPIRSSMADQAELQPRRFARRADDAAGDRAADRRCRSDRRALLARRAGARTAHADVGAPGSTDCRLERARRSRSAPRGRSAS